MTRVYRIPTPPSTNNLYLTIGRGKKRPISPKYRKWIGEARAMLLGQKPDPVPGRVVIFLSVPPTGSVLADIDNRNKAAIDLLVAEGVIDGDSRKYVTAVLTSWGSAGDTDAFISAEPVRAMTVNFVPTADGSGGGWFVDAPFTNGEPNDGVVAS